MFGLSLIELLVVAVGVIVGTLLMATVSVPAGFVVMTGMGAFGVVKVHGVSIRHRPGRPPWPHRPAPNGRHVAVRRHRRAPHRRARRPRRTPPMDPGTLAPCRRVRPDCGHHRPRSRRTRPHRRPRHPHERQQPAPRTRRQRRAAVAGHPRLAAHRRRSGHPDRRRRAAARRHRRLPAPLGHHASGPSAPPHTPPNRPPNGCCWRSPPAEHATRATGPSSLRTGFSTASDPNAVLKPRGGRRGDGRRPDTTTPVGTRAWCTSRGLPQCRSCRYHHPTSAPPSERTRASPKTAARRPTSLVAEHIFLPGDRVAGARRGDAPALRDANERPRPRGRLLHAEDVEGTSGVEAGAIGPSNGPARKRRIPARKAPGSGTTRKAAPMPPSTSSLRRQSGVANGATSRPRHACQYGKCRCAYGKDEYRRRHD